MPFGGFDARMNTGNDDDKDRHEQDGGKDPVIIPRHEPRHVRKGIGDAISSAVGAGSRRRGDSQGERYHREEREQNRAPKTEAPGAIL